VEAHRAEIERLMQAWREGQNEAESADEVWRHLESLTGEYSRELCEMLRLVLEPTLATRLQGGYRTGKRIDMKKVIPYIASDFRKDRIWMRRTKPSKRQYQIMVALDGSKSMQENGAGQLALEALVLISRALARLEVGEIGVVRFGEDVDLVHPFESPFSDAAGARMIQKFDFVDEQTDVLKFMAAAVPMLENARNSGSGNGVERVQIVFVISDAVFSNREACREWVSAAAAKNQLIVFIIVDNAKAGASVLERKSFQFNEEGKMNKVKAVGFGLGAGLGWSGVVP
jgi:midasin